MRIILGAALAAICLLANAVPVQAQSAGHWAAWDRHEGKKVVRQRGVKRVRVTRAGPRRSIAARLSPAIARSPLAILQPSRSVSTQILPHPAGCPRRLFCGCGAAIEVFGTPIRHLWLAANWLKFPPAAPGPGMVAANRRHVMVIRQYLGNGTAVVYDANGGGGLTRVHVRSLAGYSIRNPRA